MVGHTKTIVVDCALTSDYRKQRLCKRHSIVHGGYNYTGFATLY